MDISETYVKMCEKAEGIQKSGKDIKDINNYYDQHGIGLVWLPRQDQLQEMVGKKNTRELLIRFTDWIEKETDYRRESMEQLWLAFVMFTLYQKRWDNGEWRVENDRDSGIR